MILKLICAQFPVSAVATRARCGINHFQNSSLDTVNTRTRPTNTTRGILIINAALFATIFSTRPMGKKKKKRKMHLEYRERGECYRTVVLRRSRNNRI